MKIGILIASKINEHKKNVLEHILKDESLIIKIGIIDKRKEKSKYKKIIKHLRKKRGAYIIIMAIQSFFKSKEFSFNTMEYLSKKNIQCLETTNINSPRVIQKIRSHNLDLLILLNGFGILKKDLLNSSKNGVLSYHHGDMRKYRGMPPIFWELYNNEQEIGITVQKLDTRLDAGIPIVEKKITIDHNDNYKSLKKKTRVQSEPMMFDALKKIQSGKANYKEIKKLGKVYTLPNFRQWVKFQIKRAIRRLLNN